MRLATASGRLARPAPPGNDDPCGERRTIPEGMPRLPREAFERGLRRAVPNPRSLWRRGTDNGEHGPGPEIPRGAPKGERPFAGTTRRLDAGGVCLPRLRISNAATGDLWCATNARRALLLGPVVR